MSDRTDEDQIHHHPIEIIVQEQRQLQLQRCLSGSDSDEDGDVHYVEASSSYPGEHVEMRLRRGENGSNELMFDEHKNLDVLPEDLEDMEADLSHDANWMCLPDLLGDYKVKTGRFMKKVWAGTLWKGMHFSVLPEWMQDNDFLHQGHRPPLPRFTHCFKSIFRIHTETGNIWTHMLGCAAFIGVAGYFLTRPEDEIQWVDKLVFSAFFGAAIACLGFSFAFHTVNCHSREVGKIFSKLDYVGITIQIVGSFVPWLYYGFYCRLAVKISYMVIIFILGCVGVTVSLWDKFSEPKYRSLRAGVFIAMGLSAVIPTIHYCITDGFWAAVYEASFGWLVLMAALYIGGALMYACRVPERFFPGKFDLWFQSHQIFHVFVVSAAFVHYHGITEVAMVRLNAGTCEEQLNTPFTF